MAPPRAPAIVRVKQATRGAGRCRGCNAPIVWFETETGARMPFDKGFVIEATGIVEPLDGGPRFVIAEISNAFAHWATCPATGQFRRKGAGARS